MTVSEELTKRSVSALFHYIKGLSTAVVVMTYSERLRDLCRMELNTQAAAYLISVRIYFSSERLTLRRA